MVDVGDAARDVGEAAWAREGVLRARGDRLLEVDRLEDGLGVIEGGQISQQIRYSAGTTYI